MGLDDDAERVIKDAEKERQRQHERVMRKTLLKKTRIEQKASIKQTKVRSANYLVLQPPEVHSELTGLTAREERAGSR